MRNYIVYCIVLLTVFSCSVQLEKKRYSRGYYLNSNLYSLGKTKMNNKEKIAEFEKVISDVDVVDSLGLIDCLLVNQIEIVPQKNEEKINIVVSNKLKNENFKKQIVKEKKKQKNNNLEISKAYIPQSNNTFSILNFALLTSLVNFMIFKFGIKKNTKYRLRKWAFKNKTKSKWIIFSSSVIIAIAGFTSGNILHSLGLQYNYKLVNIIFSFGSLVIVYITILNKTKSILFKQVIYNLMVFCAFLMFSNIGIDIAQKSNKVSDFKQYRTPESLETSNDLQPNKITFGKIFGVILITALAIFLSLIIAGISCELSCSGYIFQAAFLFFIGHFVLLFLTFYINRTILYKKCDLNAKFLFSILLFLLSLFLLIITLDYPFLAFVTNISIISLILSYIYGLFRKE